MPVFDANSTTTDEALQGQDLSGKLALITGASTGPGKKTALASKGAEVVMAMRDLVKGDVALADIQQSLPAARLELSEIDLTSLASVRAFTERFHRSRLRRGTLVALGTACGTRCYSTNLCDRTLAARLSAQSNPHTLFQ